MTGKENKQAEKSTVKELKPWPNYIEERIKLFDKLKEDYAIELEGKNKEPITVTLPDGKKIDALSWQTTPYDIAKTIRLVTLLGKQYSLKFKQFNYP